MSGIRLSARDIAYYFALKTPLANWTDNGLLNLEVGNGPAVHHGVALTLEVDSVPTSSDQQSFYNVTKVNLDIGLAIRLTHTKHWIINSIVGPLISPVIRKALSYVAAQHLKRTLQDFDRKLFAIHREALEIETDPSRAIPSFETYWDAMQRVNNRARILEQEEQEQEEAEAEASDEPQAETHTHIQPTLKGVIITRHTNQPDVTENGNAGGEGCCTESEAETSSEETVIALGVGEQILPGRGGRADDPSTGGPQASIEEQSKQAADHLKRMGKRLENTFLETVESTEIQAIDARRTYAEAVDRAQEVREAEQQRGGWRSDAFDL
jgi:hypothetical protein